MPKGRSETDYERSDVPPRLLAALAAGFAATIGIILVALSIAFPHALQPVTRGPLQPLPPQPRLQTAPALDLARYRAAEDQRLDARGPAKVPIDQAMNDVASEGWSER